MENEFTQNMKSLNRIRLSLGEDGTEGIVTFLSESPDFILTLDSNNYIKSFLEMKFTGLMLNSLKSLNLIEHLFSTYNVGMLEIFVNQLCSMICKELEFEACSVFLFHSKQKMLELIATSSKQPHNAPCKSIKYTLNDKGSITLKAFKEQQMLFSYGRENDMQAIQKYKEKNISVMKNWIIVPLISEKRPLGVLRVTNKYQGVKGRKYKIIDFSPSDVASLSVISSSLSNIINIEEVHQKYVDRLKDLVAKQEELKIELDQQKNFFKVFLHEIRTPISAFSTSTLIIKKMLDKAQLDKQKIEPIKAKISDIQAMGERLAFIANTFQFDKLVKARNPMYLSVCRDIINPVVNISRDYNKKQYGLDIVIDEDSLKDATVFGDKELLCIVLNTLLNNALKYSNKSTAPIYVSGETDKKNNFVSIIVSNYGIEIADEEQGKIFEKGYRGTSAVRQKIAGAGIGLHLSKRIIQEQQGDLILTSRKNPVTFKIKIPTIKSN